MRHHWVLCKSIAKRSFGVTVVILLLQSLIIIRVNWVEDYCIKPDLTLASARGIIWEIEIKSNYSQDIRPIWQREDLLRTEVGWPSRWITVYGSENSQSDGSIGEFPAAPIYRQEWFVLRTIDSVGISVFRALISFVVTYALVWCAYSACSLCVGCRRLANRKCPSCAYPLANGDRSRCSECGCRVPN